MPWVKKYLSLGEGATDSAGNPLDPESAYWIWEDEGPIPEGNVDTTDQKKNLLSEFIAEQEAVTGTRSPHRDLSPDVTEGIGTPSDIDGPLDNLFPQSPLRVSTEDPVEAALRSKNPQAVTSLIDNLTRTEGKTPEQRFKLPTFTEEFPSFQRRARQPLIESGAAEEVGPYNDPSEPIVDALASPFHRASLAARGKMSAAQQRDFLVNTVLGAAGGGAIGAPIGAFIGAAQASDNPPTTPDALIPFQRDTVIDTIGGPARVSHTDLTMIGGMAAVSLGMAFAPKIFSKLRFGQVPRLRPAGENTAPGTMFMSTSLDLARTYDDVNAGALRLMRRAGVNPAAAEKVEEVFRLQTRATTNALTDSAVSVGRMQTPSYNFQVRVPVSQLNKVETPQMRDYMHVLDTIEEIKLAGLTNRQINNPQAGPIVVRGMDLPTAWQLKRNLEMANPEVVEYAKAFRDNVKAVRKFQADGEYATLPVSGQGSLRFLNANRANEVPFQGGRVRGEPVDRGSPTENLATTMRERIRQRMENEAVGLYVDEVRKVQPNLFKRVTDAELSANPNWNRNVVEFKRRGKTEKYTTDPFLADVLKMDPYYMTSGVQNLFYSTKRWMEITTTGELAPWFAPVSMLRSWQIGKLTTPEGMRSPTLLGSAAAIPQQVYPQMARSASEFLDRNSGGWLGQVFGRGNLQAVGQRLAAQYDRSLWAQLEAVGGGRGSIMQQQTQANSRLTRAIQNVRGPDRTALEGYRALLNAVHNAPAFNFVKRNVGKKDLPVLAANARHMTGDPRIGGQYFTGAGSQAKPIRFENEESRVSHMAGQAAKFYGGMTEIGRTSIPWYNATIQGMKRIGEAYVDNPAKFTAYLWLYQSMPAASLYLYTRSLDKDPNGVSYVDHMMNRRSEYDKVMNFYIPVPGRPAEHGIRFPRVHEFTIAGHMMEVAMDHAFRSSLFPMKEDFLRAASSIGQVFEPPVPPIFNVLMASQGMIMPQGAFSGEAYRRRDDPFNQNGGLPGSIELYARAVAPGVSDIVGAWANAYISTPEGFLDSVANANRAAGRRLVSKTPVARDLFDIHPPATGNTAITEELFKKQRAIRQLDSFYREWTKSAGSIGAKPRSTLGEEVAVSHLGERPPTESAGINQPKPTNPLYNMFIEELHNRFIKDAPWDRRGNETGAIGFQSLWNRYGIATRNIQRLRNVNEGNMVTWQRQLEQRPEQLDFLKKNGVNPMKLEEVRDFYERMRHNAARTLLFQIKMVENEFSERLGRPIKIEDINPFGKGLAGPDQSAPQVTPVQPEVYND